jgi:hypothetical protein
LTIQQLHAVVAIDFNLFVVKLDLYGPATNVKQVPIRLSNRRFEARELSV